MRTFSCVMTERNSATPTLSFILADTEERARELVRRELSRRHDAVSVELCEGAKVLWAQTLGPQTSLARPTASPRPSSWRRKIRPSRHKARG